MCMCAVLSDVGIAWHESVIGGFKPTDGDGLYDGQELKGWTVTIIYDRTKEKAKQYHVTSDPWLTDADNDGISHGDGIPDNREKEGQLTVIEGENPELSGMSVGWSIHYNDWHFPDGLELHFAFFAKDNAGLHRFAAGGLMYSIICMWEFVGEVPTDAEILQQFAGG